MPSAEVISVAGLWTACGALGGYRKGVTGWEVKNFDQGEDELSFSFVV